MLSILGLRLTAVHKTALVVGSVVLVLIALLVLTAAKPQTVLDDDTLVARALEEAHLSGLQGDPVAQRAVRMTYGEWLKLNDSGLEAGAAQFELTPGMPVFVLVMRGNVEWAGPGLPRPGQDGREHFDNMIVVLNAQTGGTLWVGSWRKGFALPVPAP